MAIFCGILKGDSVQGETITLNPESIDQAIKEREEKSPLMTMELSANLLAVAAKGLSFATPGHRSGRSFGLTGKLLRRVT